MRDPVAARRIIASIRFSFTKDRWPSVEKILRAYGTEPHEREVDRVRLAILKISEGSAQKVQEYVAIAKKDYRDVLFWADHPQPAKVSPAERKKVVTALRKLGADLPEEK